MDSLYLILLALFLLVIIPRIMQRRRLAAIRHILNRKMRNKENIEMKELAKRFIGEECIIYTITSNDGSVQGLIKEIDDGGMVIEKKTGELEIINLDFVTRIRQYPRKKNGKKKDIVLDKINAHPPARCRPQSPWPPCPSVPARCAGPAWGLRRMPP